MRIFTLAIASVAAALILAGCAVQSAGELTASKNVDDSKTVITKLAQADTIKLTKKVMSIHDSWTVEADGHVVGHITGKTFRSLGNMWTLTDENDNLVDAASENILTPSHQSVMYDYNAKPRDHMRAKIFSWGDHFTSDNIDAQEKVISFNKKFSVKAKDGHTLKISKSLNPVQDIVKIYPHGANEAATLDTIWLAVITTQLDNDKASDS